MKQEVQSAKAGILVLQGEEDVNTLKTIELYDDRAKTDERLRVSQVLFEDADVILARAGFDGDDCVHTLLIGKDRGEVLTSNFEFWYAENV